MKQIKDISMFRKLSAISLLFLVWVMNACTQSHESINNPKVASFRDNYALLLGEAQEWKNDAYLHSIEFDFEVTGGKINAHFQSPSDDYESLGMVYDPGTNQITQEIFAQSAPILMHVPIREIDWKLDSVQAMDIFMSFDDIGKIWMATPDRMCNSLELRHFYVDNQWVLAWVLTIANCDISSIEHVEYFYIDPVSGERLDLKY